ncbi:hypothetical protein BVRB_4g088520 [Beta vulgaris subsp. vulgaris]|nr:hypothetical protein BVRB_4g088520 [Beta vulgaris subsp. vulgaris]
MASINSGDHNPTEDMERCVLAVEQILNFNFRNKKLLEEALTHPSCGESTSYQRLEFVGDAVLGLAFANFAYLSYPTVDEGILHLLRSANTSTNKLARVAVRHRLFNYFRFPRNHSALSAKVREFALVVESEDQTSVCGGAVKAPKVLADIVESVIAAAYIDCDFDLKLLWQVIRGFLEPIVTLETLPMQLVTMLYEFCKMQGKQVEIRDCRKLDRNICSIYVDGKLIATGTSDQNETAKLKAAKAALEKLNKSVNDMDVDFEVNDKYEIECAKQKLGTLCVKKKWSKPTYRIDNKVELDCEKKFVCSVEIQTADEKLLMLGDVKSRVKEAQNSAASMMIYRLVESSYV